MISKKIYSSNLQIDSHLFTVKFPISARIPYIVEKKYSIK